MKYLINILAVLFYCSDFAQGENNALTHASDYINKSPIQVIDVSFGSIDTNNKIIINYGDSLFASDIRYLATRIKYLAIGNEINALEFKVKLISPLGKTLANKNSPLGYTSLEPLGIFPDEEITCELKSWGDGEPWVKKTSGLGSGIYHWQLYFEEDCIFEKELIVYDGSKYDTPYELLRGDWRKLMSDLFNKFGEKEIDYEIIDKNWLSYANKGIKWEKTGWYYWGRVDDKTSTPDGEGLMIGNVSEMLDIRGVKNCMYSVGRFNKGILHNFSDGLFGWNSTFCFDANGELLKHAVFKKGKIAFESTEENNAFFSEDNNRKFRCVRYEDGFYVGCTLYGLPNGFGIYLWNEGGYYVGGWRDGKPSGYIESSWKDVDYEKDILHWTLKTPINNL